MVHENAKTKALKQLNNTTNQPPNHRLVPWPVVGGTFLAILFLICFVGGAEADNTNPIEVPNVDENRNAFEYTPSDPPPMANEWNNALATIDPGRGVSSNKLTKDKDKAKSKPKTKHDKRLSDLQDRFGDRLDDLMNATREYLSERLDPEKVTNASIIKSLHLAISKDDDLLNEIEYIARINDEAWRSIHEGQGFIVVKKALDLICIDNDAVKSSHLLAAGAVLMRKIHQMLQGISQTGKTWIQMSVGEMLPEDRVLLLDDMTPTSLKHACRADPTYLKNKVIILDEWGDLHPGVARFLKKIMSFKKERGRFKWTDKKHNSIDIYIEGMPVVFTNTCDLDDKLDKSTSLQIMNRCVVSTTIDTQEYRNAILQIQRNERLDGPIIENEKYKFDVARKIVEIVMSDEMSDIIIFNPFAKFMTDEMEDGVIHERKFLDLADASAWWNRWSNHREDNILFVEARDMLLASWIFQHLEVHTSRHIDDKCIEIFKEMNAGIGIEHRDLSEMFKDTPGLRSPQTVRDRCNRLVDAGLLQKDKGNENIQDADGKIIRYRDYTIWRPIEDPQYIDELLPSYKANQPLFNRYSKCFLSDGDFDDSHRSTLIDVIYNKLINIDSTVNQPNSTIHRKAEEIATDIISNPLSLYICDPDFIETRYRVYKGEETLASSVKNNFDLRSDSRLTHEENVKNFITFVNESDKVVSHEVIRKRLDMSREELKAVELELKDEDNNQVITRSPITIFVDWRGRKAVGQSPLRRKVEEVIPIRLSSIHNALKNYSGFIDVVTGYAVDHEWVMLQCDEDDGDTILERYEDREDLLAKQVGESEDYETDDETDDDKMFGEN